MCLAGYVGANLLLHFGEFPSRKIRLWACAIGAFVFLAGFQIVLWSIESAADRWSASKNVPALVLRLRGADIRAQETALTELAAYGPRARQALPTLVALLEDDVGFIRRDAAFAIGGMGPLAETALPALIRAQSDPQSEVRAAAQWAVQEIGRKRP